MNKKINAVTKAGLLATGACSVAMGAVYIAPPDIDSYKQKTDQSFYDMYQNQDSAIAKGANPTLQNYTNNVSTGNKVAIGNTITKTVQGTLQGSMVKTGTSTTYNIPGLGRYQFVIDNMGNVKLYGANVTQDHTAVIKEGAKADGIGRVWCSRTQSVSFGKSSATKCVNYKRNAIEKDFDLITGKYVQREVTQETNGISHCYSTGKDSGYCRSHPNYNGFNSIATSKVFTQSVNVSDILKNNQTYTLKSFDNKMMSIYTRGKLDNVRNNYDYSYATNKNGKG